METNDRMFEMFDENGKLKPKEQILDDISDFYDELASPVLEETEAPASMEQILEDFSFNERCLYIYDVITDEYIHSLILSIKYWNRLDDDNDIPIEKRKPIKIYINTPGGDLDATLTIIDAIEMSKTPIYTVAVGKSYSGGFFITICGDKRIGYPHSSYLFHEGFVSWESDAHKSIQHNEFYIKQLEMLKKIVLSHTNVSEEEYNSHKRDDWWFDAETALKYNIVDEIATELI